jgi:hypothetical protein
MEKKLILMLLIIQYVYNVNCVCDAPTTTTRAQVTTTTTTAPTTTTAKVTNIIDLSQLVCINGDGFYPDKLSGCRKFYRCVYTGTQYVQVNEFFCPDQTLFSSSLSICVWQGSVVCV